MEFLFWGIIIFINFAIFGYIVSRYRTCPSDKILVVYGQTGQGKSCKCIHGGGVFVVPVVQDYQYLDLTPIEINSELQTTLSRDNIKLNVSSKITVVISTEPGVMENAAERLLSQGLQAMQDMVKDIIEGQVRLIIAQTDSGEIRKNIAKITSIITENADIRINKIGLKLIDFNIARIKDENSKILI